MLWVCFSCLKKYRENGQVIRSIITWRIIRWVVTSLWAMGVVFSLFQSGGKNKPAVPILGLTFHKTTEKVTIPLRAWLILLLILTMLQGSRISGEAWPVFEVRESGGFFLSLTCRSLKLCWMRVYSALLHRRGFFDNCKRILRWKDLGGKIAFSVEQETTI